MRKSKIKGYDAFALLSELDDGMIAEAALPEVGRTVTDKSSRKDREPGLFARFLDSNWAAAIISMTVAVAVLMGIIAAGRMETKAPNRQEGVDNPAGTNQVALEAVPGESNALREDESDELPEFNVTPDNTPGRLPNQETGPVEVISDGFTVYPKGYCVWASGQQLDENGEMTGFDADGFGAVNQLGAIKDEIPKMSTSGNSFSLSLSDGMTLQNIRVFKIVEIQNDTFEELALGVEGEDFSHDPIMYLATLPKNGDYIVVLEIHYENCTSADEYIMGVNEYAFWLTTGSGWDSKAPVRITHNDRAYLLERYTLQKSYYDAELGKEMVTDYDGAEKILKTLVKNMQTVTVVRGEPLSLYLAPFYDLKSVKAYCGLELWEEYDSEEPLELLAEWDADDYYFIFTAVYNGTGETEVAEFPIHIRLLDDVTAQPPAIDTNSYPFIENLVLNNGYMLWTEQWYDGGMVSGDGAGAEGQLSDLVAEGALEGYRLRFPADTPFEFGLGDHEASLDRVSVYDMSTNRLGEAKNFTVIHELPAGEYIVILTVTEQGAYIPEADAFEAACYEYPFILEVYNP